MDCKENVEIVKRYLDRNDWHYEVKETDSAVMFASGVNTENCVFSSIRYRIIVDENCVQNFALLPVGAGEKRAEVAEFIARVNYPLKRGRLDMDYADGEIRYHLHVPIAAVRQDPDDTLQDVLCLPGLILSRYGNGIAKIVFGDVDPKTAYELCEKEMK